MQEMSVHQKLEAASRMPLRQNPHKFVARPLRGHVSCKRVQTDDRRLGIRVDVKTETRGKPNSPKKAQMILPKALLGIAYGPDGLALKVVPAAHKVEDVATVGVHEKGIYGEVTPSCVLRRVGFKIYLGRMP